MLVGPRRLVLVLEGLAPTLLERWRDVLPGFRALRTAGASGPLFAPVVPYEASALASAFTGSSVGEHGVWTYWQVRPPVFGERPRLFRPEELGLCPVWRNGAIRAATVNVFGLGPGDSLWIDYPMEATLRGCEPPTLLRELRARDIPYLHDVTVLYRGEGPERFWTAVERIEEARMKVVLDLFDGGFDLVVANITLLDRMSHFFWGGAANPDGPESPDSWLGRAYRRVDRFLDALLGRLRAFDRLLVFSEIGFGPLTRFVRIDSALEAAGLLAWQGDAPHPSTVAMEAVQGSHGVLVRRDDVSEQEAERRLEHVAAVLRDARDPVTGAPLFACVDRGARIAPGPRAHAAPDLVCLPADESVLPLGDPRWARHVSRTLQTGWHRRESLWAEIGPKVGSGRPADCRDVAATVAGWLDLPAPTGTRPLSEAECRAS